MRFPSNVTQSIPILRILFSPVSPAASASKAVICATSARVCGHLKVFATLA